MCIPKIDRTNGFTSVFTLNVKPFYQKYYALDSEMGNNYYIYSSYENNNRRIWKDHFNTTPGILIKYFNGIEKQISMKD